MSETVTIEVEREWPALLRNVRRPWASGGEGAPYARELAALADRIEAALPPPPVPEPTRMGAIVGIGEGHFVRDADGWMELTMRISWTWPDMLRHGTPVVVFEGVEP